MTMKVKKKFSTPFLTNDKEEDYRKSLMPISEEKRAYEFTKFVKFKDRSTKRVINSEPESVSPMRIPNFKSNRDVITVNELTGKDLYMRYKDKSFLVKEE